MVAAKYYFLSQAVFDLHTHMEIDAIDFYYGRLPYFINKKLNADLITKINTSSLALIFERNQLLINQLPVDWANLQMIKKLVSRRKNFIRRVLRKLQLLPPFYARHRNLAIQRIAPY